MLTILHDREDFDGDGSEVASAQGLEVRARSGATCELARRLLSMGYPGSTPVRLVREDPWLHGPLVSVTGISLLLASRLDFFADPKAPGPGSSPSDHRPTEPLRPQSTMRR
jgi:Fe2+ transport system protein FeoA